MTSPQKTPVKTMNPAASTTGDLPVDKCVAKPREARHIQWRRSIAGEFRAAVLVKHKPAVPQKCNQDQPDQCIDFLHPEGCGTDVIVCKGENAPLFVAEYEISQ